jgi:hypothetical protein
MRRCGFGRAAIVPGLMLLVAVLVPRIAAGQAPAAETKTIENARFRFAVALPAGCRHDEGPGTIDAVCAVEFDPEKSAKAAAAVSLWLTVSAETVADDAGKTPAELPQRYGVAAFRDELPEAVCGESDKARVKIGNVKEVVEEAHVVYTADVVCAEVRFLHVGERHALVRYVVAPDARYRLVARAPAEDFEKERETIDAFFASFRVLPAAK